MAPTVVAVFTRHKKRKRLRSSPNHERSRMPKSLAFWTSLIRCAFVADGNGSGLSTSLSKIVSGVKADGYVLDDISSFLSNAEYAKIEPLFLRGSETHV